MATVTVTKLKPKRKYKRPPGGEVTQPVAKIREDRRRTFAAVKRGIPGGPVGVLMTAMAIPSSTPIRFPTSDMPRTAVLSTTDIFTLGNCDAGAGSIAHGFSQGDLLLALYGQPGRMFSYFSTLTPAGTYGARFANTTNTSPSSGEWVVAPAALTSGVQTQPGWWPLLAFPSTSSTTYGPSIPVGYSKGVPYVLMNSNTSSRDALKMSLVVAGGGTVNVYWSIFQWTDVDVEPVLVTSAFTNVVGTATVTVQPPLTTVQKSSYIALRIATVTYGAGTATNVKVTIDFEPGATSGWVNVPSGDMDAANTTSDPAIGEEIRAVSSSLLVTNVTAFNSRQGTITAARVRNVPLFDMTSSMLARAAEKYHGDAALGTYTFMEFSEPRAQFTTCFNKYTCMFNLDLQDWYHLIQVSNSNYATSNNTFQVTAENMWEFKTDSARYAKGVSPFTLPQLCAARARINSRPDWFYENPNHMAKIYQMVRGVGDAVGKYGPPVARGVGAAMGNQVAGDALAILLELLRR